jgi:hypothetical protein
VDCHINLFFIQLRFMKNLQLLALIILFTLGIYFFEHISFFFLPKSSSECDVQLWEHVYKEFAGTIMSIEKQRDGDAVIKLKVDSEYNQFLSWSNFQKQRGNLVVVAVCQYPVFQATAEEACDGTVQKIDPPKVGEKVRVVGVFVQDLNQKWHELHPVTKIQSL